MSYSTNLTLLKYVRNVQLANYANIAQLSRMLIDGSRMQNDNTNVYGRRLTVDCRLYRACRVYAIFDENDQLISGPELRIEDSEVFKDFVKCV